MGEIVRIAGEVRITPDFDRHWNWHNSQVLFCEQITCDSAPYEASFSDLRTKFGSDVRAVLRGNECTNILDLMSYGAGLLGLARDYQIKGVSMALAKRYGSNESSSIRNLDNIKQLYGDLFHPQSWDQLQLMMATLKIESFHLVFCRGQGAMSHIENPALHTDALPYRQMVSRLAQVLAPNALIFTQLPSCKAPKNRLLRLFGKLADKKMLEWRHIDPPLGPGAYDPVRLQVTRPIGRE